jgi:hypothetical protein
MNALALPAVIEPGDCAPVIAGVRFPALFAPDAPTAKARPGILHGQYQEPLHAKSLRASRA